MAELAPIVYGSVCSGIEAATVAWHPLGWRPRFFAEIDAFPAAVLAHHYPDVPNHGDFTAIPASAGPIDLLVGGTPCQDFSVAGLRAGLAGERGNLTLKFLELLDRLRPTWMVWENVPGVLSDNGGRSFGAFLGGLAQLGYGWAYRILDAQFFGVPQRRNRVFVVGCLGDGARAGAVLFERHSLRGHPAPRRQAESAVAPSVTPGARRASGNRSGEQITVVPPLTTSPWADRDCQHEKLVADTLTSHHGRNRPDETFVVAHALRADGFDASEDGTGRGTPLVVDAYQCQGSNVGPMGTLRKGNGNTSGGVPFIVNAAESCAVLDHARPSEVARCLDSTGSFANNQGGTVVVSDSKAIAFMERGRPDGRTIEWQEDLAYAQDVKAGGGAGSSRWVATFDERNITSAANRSRVDPEAPCHTLHAVPPTLIGSGVRRLTPRECERLQGFPDDWTRIPGLKSWRAMSEFETPDELRELGLAVKWSKKRSEWRVNDPDGPRYRAVGNSMAVPVMRWIGERIDRVRLVFAESEVAG